MRSLRQSYARIKEWTEKNWNWLFGTLFLLAALAIGMLLRFKLFPYHTADLDCYLGPWYTYLKEHGGFSAVGDEFGDYTPAYYYFMAALTYTKLDFATGIKLISTIFDAILAFYVMQIVQLKEPKDSKLPLIAAAVTFCLPTVFLNSAAWGQCDAIYTLFIVIGLYELMKGSDTKAMIMIGVSFAFKVQTVFIMPLIGILIMLKKIRWRTLLWIPAVYVASIIPATLAGGKFTRLLTVYFMQSGEYPYLTMKLPNIYTVWGQTEQAQIGGAGIYFAGICVIVFMYYYITHKKMKLTKNTAVCLALLSAFIVPFVLPYMHERYMYLMEILFVIFAFYFAKRGWLIVTTQFVSVQCLSIYLFAQEMFDLRPLTWITIFHAAVVAYTLRKELEEPSDPDEIMMKFEKQKKPAVSAKSGKSGKEETAAAQ